MMAPKLDDKQRRALVVLRDGGIVNGRDLERLTGVPAADLVCVLRDLYAQELIKYTGNPMNPDGLRESYFNIPPSAIRFADMLIKSGL